MTEREVHKALVLVRPIRAAAMNWSESKMHYCVTPQRAFVCEYMRVYADTSVEKHTLQ